MTTLHTREPLKTNRSPLFAAAAAIGAAGLLLTVPAPAQATPMFPLAPPCNSYQFPGGYVLFHEPTTNFSFRFDTTGKPSTSVAGTLADGTDKKGAPFHGTAQGGISGRHVDITVNWDNGTYQGYVGDVGTDGYAHGRTQNNHPDQSGIPWDLVSAAFTCADAPVPPANAGTGAQGGTGAETGPVVEKPPPAPTATVTSDVDLYDVPGGSGRVIDLLKTGQVVTLDTTENSTCPANDWCVFADPKGAAWGFVKNN